MTEFEPIDTRFFTAEREAELDVVGTTVPRVDARAHVTGGTKFYEDVSFPNMLHLKMARSTRHHALLKKVDTKQPRRCRASFARSRTRMCRTTGTPSCG